MKGVRSKLMTSSIEEGTQFGRSLVLSIKRALSPSYEVVVSVFYCLDGYVEFGLQGLGVGGYLGPLGS